jgi:ribosomal protein S18 acetylase RimI-like enzyme
VSTATGQVVIRRLLSGDEELAGRLALAFKSSSGNLASLSNFLSNPLNYLFVALDDDEPVGFVLAYQLQRIDGESAKMFLYEIDVAEKYRRLGIASALIGELESICKAGSFINMFVLTNESNAPATGLYLKTGGQAKTSDDLMFVYDYNNKRVS